MYHSESLSNDFRVYIYESEYRQIEEWTMESHNLEIGGDLFGLWQDNCTAVVQLVLGPGKGCQRTATSFYQDVDYLDRVGNHLTSKESLCHIGEWHSHHRLGLTRPRRGDDDTVYRNMRKYDIHRFCLFIGTISQSTANVNPFFYETEEHTGGRRAWRRDGTIYFISAQQSPFRTKLMNCIDVSAWEMKRKNHQENPNKAKAKKKRERSAPSPTIKSENDRQRITHEKQENKSSKNFNKCDDDKNDFQEKDKLLQDGIIEEDQTIAEKRTCSSVLFALIGIKRN